jgi:hypothetical protein
LCPACERHEFLVEHLFSEASDARGIRTAGPWQCEECDATWNIAAYKDGSIEVTAAPQRSWHNWVILELAGQGNAVIRLLAPGLVLDRETPLEEQHELNRHFYEEHTCPMNYLQRATVVALGARDRPNEFGDSDPHGLFRYVTCFDHPIRPNQVQGSVQTDALVASAEKVLAKIGRS